MISDSPDLKVVKSSDSYDLFVGRIPTRTTYWSAGFLLVRPIGRQDFRLVRPLGRQVLRLVRSLGRHVFRPVRPHLIEVDDLDFTVSNAYNFLDLSPN